MSMSRRTPSTFCSRVSSNPSSKVATATEPGICAVISAATAPE